MTDEKQLVVDLRSMEVGGFDTNGWHLTHTRRLNVMPHAHTFPYTKGTHSFDDGCVLVLFDPDKFEQIPHGPLPHTVSS